MPHGTHWSADQKARPARLPDARSYRTAIDVYNASHARSAVRSALKSTPVLCKSSAVAAASSGGKISRFSLEMVPVPAAAPRARRPAGSTISEVEVEQRAGVAPTTWERVWR